MTKSIAAGVELAHRRATILQALLIAFLVQKLVAIGSAWAQHEMLVAVQRGAQLTTEQAAANDSRQHLVAVAGIVLFIATAIIWFMWQHRAYANLGLIGSRDTEFTPGGSVGYWFIPLVNLVRPYQITAELYRRSEIQNARDSIGGLSGPPLVGAWWLVYLVWGGSQRLFSVIAKGANTIPTLISATNIQIGGYLIAVTSTVLALLVIRSIDRFQQAFPVTQPIAAP